MIKDLWNRRFFQFFATYLGAGWALIQFAEWLVARYKFNNTLVDQLAIFLLICLPAFLIFVYNHGRPGPDKWLLSEKIIIPISIVLGIIVGYISIPNNPQDFEYVELQDLNGELIKRYVPNENNIRKIGVFPFENKTGIDSLNYLRMGFPELLQNDLLQDPRLYQTTPNSLLGKAGFTYNDFFENISFSQKFKAANAYPTDYFMIGIFDIIDENYKIEFEIFESKTGKSIHKNSIINQDFYTLIDNITSQTINAIFPIEIFQTIDYKDLPAVDLVSSNTNALKNYFTGKEMSSLNSEDPLKALTFFEKAVQLDKNCAACYFELGNTKILLNGFKAGIPDIEKSVNLASFLYDRIRFYYQERFFYISFDYESQVKLLEMMIRLYPFQLSGYASLMDYYNGVNVEKAIEIGNQAIKNGFQKTISDEMGKLYFKKGEYKKAQVFFESYLKDYPNDSEVKENLIETFIALHEIDRAQILIEENVLLNPTSVEAIIKLAVFERRHKGNFEKSEKLLKQSIEKAITSNDLADAFFNLCTLKNQTGEIKEAIAYLNKSKETQYRYEIPAIVDIQTYHKEMNLYWELDSIEAFKNLKSKYIENHRSILPIVECLFELDYAETFQDTSTFLKYFPSYRDSIINFYGADNKLYLLYDAYYESLKDNNCEALNLFNKYYEVSGIGIDEVTEDFINAAINCGKYDEARKLVNSNLNSSPFWPYYHYLSAKVYLLEKDKKQAIKSLEIALDLLKNADKNNKVVLLSQNLYHSLKEN